MLATVLRYGVKYPGRVAAAIQHDPAWLFDTLRNRFARRSEAGQACQYETNADWESAMHVHIGVEWPCAACDEFDLLWRNVVNGVKAEGIDVGPLSFAGYNDGDAALVRAIWCLVRHHAPRHVVETGVAHGFTSRFILEAMERNGFGHLWSIDLPPLDPVMRSRIGIAVEERLKHRWTLIAGSSRRQLPLLLDKLGAIDMFVHDSLHTEANVRFEMREAWPKLNAGGALVVDDIDTNWGFRNAVRSFGGQKSFVGEAEPVRFDPRRFNKKGLFGIALKTR
jgi:methyltransferase family protein